MQEEDCETVRAEGHVCEFAWSDWTLGTSYYDREEPVVGSKLT